MGIHREGANRGRRPVRCRNHRRVGDAEYRASEREARASRVGRARRAKLREHNRGGPDRDRQRRLLHPRGVGVRGASRDQEEVARINLVNARSGTVKVRRAGQNEGRAAITSLRDDVGAVLRAIGLVFHQDAIGGDHKRAVNRQSAVACRGQGGTHTGRTVVVGAGRQSRRGGQAASLMEVDAGRD